MSDSVQPHRRQPIRLPRPWDSSGKNTGASCHFLLQCVKVKSESKVAQSCPTLSDPMDCSLPGFSIHGIFQARVLEWSAIAFSDFDFYYGKFSFFLTFAFCVVYSIACIKIILQYIGYKHYPFYFGSHWLIIQPLCIITILLGRNCLLFTKSKENT